MLIYVFAILKSIDENKPLPVDAASWLSQGFIRCMKNGALLHHALNLSGLRHKYLLNVRDKYLFRAWCLTDESFTDWERSKEIIIKIERFKNGRWLKIKYLSEPPTNLSPINRNLFHALKTGVKLPTTSKQINNIVKSMRVLNFHSPEV